VICILKDVDMKRFNVVIGEEFDVSAFDLESVEDVAEMARIATDQRRAKMRERVTSIILGSIGSMLIAAGVVGICDGSFDELGSVWTASALPLGFVLRTYFEREVPP
jgi:hypothetical protein